MPLHLAAGDFTRDVDVEVGDGRVRGPAPGARHRESGHVRSDDLQGLLPGLYKHDGARAFLWKQGVELRDFTAYAKASTERIANNARKLVTDAGRPVISFDHVKTRNRTQRKDELAKSIADADGDDRRDHLPDLGG